MVRSRHGRTLRRAVVEPNLIFRRTDLRLSRIFATSMAATLLTLASVPALAQTNWGVIKTFPIGGEGSWDYVTVDSPGHRLFVTRSTHTMVVDSTSGKVLGDIPGQKG